MIDLYHAFGGVLFFFYVFYFKFQRFTAALFILI